ncbi:carbohydrate esterase family 16 protein [Moniliophthora roreri MCA 2997]|nr:carbohydrate esterase family 16 protein [Moniliophthora roreri MCA 2997]KAI3608191.1 carbohydrate esterase family 16 protein [Moniliophthora roreri]
MKIQGIFLYTLGFLGTLHSPGANGQERNDGIHLAVSPICGSFPGNVADINAGIDPERIRTIVSFGDSFTDGGNDDGSSLLPPVIIPPDPKAGGRSTNGPVWVEGVADDMRNATLMDYAQWAACTDLSLWPSNPRKVDFVGQVKTFLNQQNKLDPETTLYSIFFGINDYIAHLTENDNGTRMHAAAEAVLTQIDILSSAPTNGRSFMVLDVYGRGSTDPAGEDYKQTIYNGLAQRHSNRSSPLNVAFVDYARIWNGVLGEVPGYKAFGYASTGQCVGCSSDCDENGWCTDAAHHFYWFDGHPSKETHRIMADYVGLVLRDCKI